MIEYGGVGQAFGGEELPLRAREVLAAAVEIAVDEAFKDLARVDNTVARSKTAGAEWGKFLELETSFGDYIPRRYLARCSYAVLKRFTVCLITVGWKLAQPQYLYPACVAEELALAGILNRAGAWLEIAGKEPFDFDSVKDLLFQDLDHEYLFASELDGIDLELGDQLGMASLAFSDWFKPFNQGQTLPHPYSA